MADSRQAGSEVAVEVKFAIIGPSGVGKTSLFGKLRDPYFDIEAVEPGFGVDVTTVDVSENQVSILDVAGSGTVWSFVQGVQAALLVFSLDDEASFRALDEFLKQLKSECGNPKIPVLLVGNKSDRPVKVSESIIEEWISNHGWLRYFQVSAKTDVNAITDLFISLVDVALGKKPATNPPSVRVPPDKGKTGDEKNEKISAAKAKEGNRSNENGGGVSKTKCCLLC
jgi:small GTP-binding protein